ncbi:MAG: acyl-CoA dehydrogenase family protein [Acidimicrobiales bacterium]
MNDQHDPSSSPASSTAASPTGAGAVRDEVRAWLAGNWSADLDRNDWMTRLVDSGWAAPSWPAQWYGKGLDPALTNVVVDEFRRVGAEGTAQDKVNLWANTVLAFGSDDLKREFLAPLLRNQVAMCLLYSEPGAGSDLAAVQTRADRDGDEWVVTGQKVWTSSGRHADYGMLIARTDWDVPKHRGISFFWLPMRQPGVEVRPLRQATGDARFNEVFITEARVAHANMLGGENEGWRVLQTALAYERAVMGENQRRRKGVDPGRAVRSADDEANAPIPDLSLLDLARDMGRADDPVIRQRLMRLRELVQVNEWNNRRAKAEIAQGSSSSVVSLGKLAMSGILHHAGRLQVDLLGPEGTLGGESSARSADATYAMLNAYFTSIGGGTDQIQRNIIGERILGLPKEPEVDKNVPFRDVRRATAQ